LEVPENKKMFRRALLSGLDNGIARHKGIASRKLQLRRVFAAVARIAAGKSVIAEKVEQARARALSKANEMVESEDDCGSGFSEEESNGFAKGTTAAEQARKETMKAREAVQLGKDQKKLQREAGSDGDETSDVDHSSFDGIEGYIDSPLAGFELKKVAI
jgi:hypothetical protein